MKILKYSLENIEVIPDIFLEGHHLYLVYVYTFTTQIWKNTVIFTIKSKYLAGVYGLKYLLSVRGFIIRL